MHRHCLENLDHLWVQLLQVVLQDLQPRLGQMHQYHPVIPVVLGFPEFLGYHLVLYHLYFPEVLGSLDFLEFQ